MFAADCTAALATTLAAMALRDRLWEMRGPGRWAGSLTTDLAHWAESGVETASELEALLEAEYQRERRKDDLWDGITAAEWVEMEAAEARARADRLAAEAAAEAERIEAARWTLWDYELDAQGRVRFAA